MKRIPLMLFISAWSSVMNADPAIDMATVTLPYTELLKLLEGAEAAGNKGTEVEAQPPVDVVMRSVSYSIDCTVPDSATMDALFHVSNLSGEWQSIALVEANEAIRSVEPAEAKIAEINGFMSLLLEPMETACVAIEIQTDTAMDTGGSEVVADFHAVGAALSLLQVRYDGDPATLEVTGAVAGNHDKTEFSLPSSGGHIQVKRYRPEAVRPTEWAATATHWIQDVGGMAEITCHLRLDPTDEGRTTTAKVSLANPASLLSVEKTGVSETMQTSLEMSRHGPRVHLNWPDDGAMRREVIVKYTVPTEMIDGRISIPLLEVPGSVRLDSNCYVSEFKGIELMPLAGDWQDPPRLPDWVRQNARVEDLNYLSRPGAGTLELSARALPRLTLPSATIQNAAYLTELVADGGMLHRAHVTIEHAGAAAYVFRLPEGGKLLSCTLNGSTTVPLLAGGQQLRIDLPKPGGSTGITKVGYSFTMRGKKMDPVDGKADLELPSTPLFLQNLTWEVQLPGEYEATAMQGNVVIASGGSAGRTIRLTRQIFDDEAPFASIFYTRKDLTVPPNP